MYNNKILRQQPGAPSSNQHQHQHQTSFSTPTPTPSTPSKPSIPLLPPQISKQTYKKSHHHNPQNHSLEIQKRVIATFPFCQFAFSASSCSVPCVFIASVLSWVDDVTPPSTFVLRVISCRVGTVIVRIRLRRCEKVRRRMGRCSIRLNII